MSDFTPTQQDLYPGQPSKDALQWSLDFCLRNLDYDENYFISLAFDYYRAVVLAEKRYNKLIAELSEEEEPSTTKPLTLKEYFREAKRIIRENEYAI